MKKRTLLLVLILATAVYAGQNLESNFTKGIVEYNDFPLDNIHILRLQEASTSLGGNVSELKREMAAFQEQRSREITNLQSTVDGYQRTMMAQIAVLQSSIDRLSGRLDYATEKISGAQVAEPEVQTPAGTTSPYIPILLGANVFLLLLVIVLIFWLREQYRTHKESHKFVKEEHIHPAPPELIAYVDGQLEKGKRISDIRMELANKGWTPSIIEHAIHAAREK
ncbi:Uncharacterised protein [uncultured archaeon]|nr:Uncharacterised protein [uncultured archaeon]